MSVQDIMDRAVGGDEVHLQSVSTLCEAINRRAIIAVDVSKALKDKMKNYKRPLVLEIFIKNCPNSHPVFGSRKFQTSLEKIVTNRKMDDMVKRKLAASIQDIACAFRQLPESWQHFFPSAYIQMRIKGVNFPPEPAKASFIPPRVVEKGRISSTDRSPSPTGDKEEKYSSEILMKMCNETIEALTQALTEGQTDIATSSVVGELLYTLETQRKQVVEVLQNGEVPEAQMNQMLQTNDSAETMIGIIREARKGNTASEPPRRSSNTPYYIPDHPDDHLGNVQFTQSGTYVPEPNAAKASAPPATLRSPSQPSSPPSLLHNNYGSTSKLASPPTPSKSRRRVEQINVPQGAVQAAAPVVQRPVEANFFDIDDDFASPQKSSSYSPQYATQPPYNPQMLHPNHQQGYPSPQQAYPSPQQGYPSPQQGYPSPQQGYPSPQLNYGSSQNKNLDTLFDELAIDAFGGATQVPSHSNIPEELDPYAQDYAPHSPHVQRQQRLSQQFSPQPVSSPQLNYTQPPQAQQQHQSQQQPNQRPANNDSVDLLGLW
ncbi:hypothetical protein PROFUN_07380 [Planoprotostelium fungivorum]|uniref:VHS domain-containing protein n=1 Tax=Planoprotostelium fungivorum TaxID=1890364 RepID=A0A2P6MTH4_9EUKA|nr:hypothetical protein PROFUN_07380 [Planoprotostelium fungivorum]